MRNILGLGSLMSSGALDKSQGGGGEPDTRAILTIGCCRFRRQPRPADLDEAVPELFEVSARDGTVYAVAAEKDWLIAVMHRLQPETVGMLVTTTLPVVTKPWSLIKVQVLNPRKHVMFEYCEVWKGPRIWARFPTEVMARQALTKMGRLTSELASAIETKAPNPLPRP